jgi:flagellar basal body P-ring protein FlgI
VTIVTTVVPARMIQSTQGNQNVQIRDVGAGASIQVSVGGRPPRRLPLDRALVPVAAHVVAPSRLLRARAAVVPWSARSGTLTELIAWTASDAPCAIQVVGGPGGSGKTRLGVELCRAVRPDGWVCGMLRTSYDLEQLETLCEVPSPRLVVVDYAENRGEQLEVLLPALLEAATAAQPVRVLLLVRAAPQGTGDWSSMIGTRSEVLDAALDDATELVLQAAPFGPSEREQLFAGAVQALAERLGSNDALDVEYAQPELGGATFATPLMVLIAAFLAVREGTDRLATRQQLLSALAEHEDRYWSAVSGAPSDGVLRRRVVALASLAGADTETEAAGLLSLVPDLDDAPGERKRQLARWVHGLYPGPRWWNPVEPDLLGEHLVTESFTRTPTVLAGVLDRSDPASSVHPLQVYARAAADHPDLANALTHILGDRLVAMCQAAVDQVAHQTKLDLLLGETTLAAALDRALAVIPLNVDALSAGINALPQRKDLILGPLALTLTAQATNLFRQRAAANPAAYEPVLALSLTNLSNRLAEAGRRPAGLAAIEQAVEIRRRLAAGNPAAYEPDLALSLNNLSNRLAEAGRRPAGLAAIEQAVEIRRRLAAGNPAAYEPDLASSLTNLSLRLAEAGRRAAGLAASEQVIEIYRRLAAGNPAAYEPDLALSLNNLSNRLAEAGRRPAGLAAIEQAVEIRRRLAAGNPAAYEPDLALSLNNLSNRLAEAGRRPAGLAAIEQAVEIRRRLAAGNPAAYEPDLALSLNNLSNRLAEAERRPAGLAAIEQAVEIHRRLAAGNPAAYEPDLASSLNNLSVRLAEAERRPAGLAAIEQAIEIHRRLAAGNPAAYEPDLALSLNNLSNRLAEAGRRPAGLAAIEQAVEIHRRLAAGNPAAYEPDLASSLNNLSVRLAEAGRRPAGLAASEQAVEIYRRLAAGNPAAYEPDLTRATELRIVIETIDPEM